MNPKILESAEKHKDLAKLECTFLKGVGGRTAERLQKCGIKNLQDLLFHLPSHYQDRTHVTPIANLRIKDHAVLEGYIEHAQMSQGKRPSMVINLRDGTGSIRIRFFHFYASQQEQFKIGTRIRCFGEVRFGAQGKEIIHPDYQILYTEAPVSVDETLTPIYPTTEGLSQKTLRDLTQQALNLLTTENFLPDYLPHNLMHSQTFPSLKEALFFVHRPPPEAQVQQLELGVHPSQQRLAFEELLAHRLCLQRFRNEAKKEKAPLLKHDMVLKEKFLQSLAFTLTDAQQRVILEIQNDMLQASPMLRLVQGDVGSGKTIVAALAMLHAIAAGYQSALMAPTELLAEQHYINFQKWFAHLDIKVISLLGKHKGKLKIQLQESIASNQPAIVIGTHALFQEAVSFGNLGFIVIDEQHRFGVHQRLALREKGMLTGLSPHQLIMTATPIPRTLAMTAYADLDISVIDELPPGRTPVKTVVIPEQKRAQVIDRIRAAILEKRQAYWVCTLIDESEVITSQAAEATKIALTTELPEARIALIHGKTHQKEKEQIMQDFKNGELDLLVATTVIEVGVDVPNASLMIIENAERLGLSQLHQLRGRVGRGATESFCVLLYKSPLSHHAKERLQLMRTCTDGFIIAQKDLELRGAGELLGTRQTGLAQMKIADLIRDQGLLQKVKEVAEKLCEEDLEVVENLIRRWVQDGERYGVV